MQDIALAWPAWVGSPLQGGMFIALMIIAIRTSPAWLTTWSQLRLARSNANAKRIEELERQVLECRQECDLKVAALHEEIQGLRHQRNAEQLVIMRAIVGMSGDPQVKQQLELLEAMEISLHTNSKDTVTKAKATVVAAKSTLEEAEKGVENGK